MFRLELSYPMLILDSREQWLTRELEACRNYTEIQQLNWRTGSTAIQHWAAAVVTGSWTAREWNWKNTLWTDRVSSTWAQPDARWQCITYVCRKQEGKGSAAGPVSLPALQAALAKIQWDTREQGSLSPEMAMQGLFM